VLLKHGAAWHVPGEVLSQNIKRDSAVSYDFRSGDTSKLNLPINDLTFGFHIFS